MYVYRSNRLERLVDSLSAILRASPLPPFVPETIVVQSKGMERWLSMELATRLGALAHAEFPFPRAFFESCLSATPAADEKPEAYARQSLLWAIAAVLRDGAHLGRMPEVRAYLAGDSTGYRWLELSKQIAHAFDQYAVYRPELLLGWLRQADDDWQAVIWRAVVERLGPGHLPGRVERFFRDSGSSRADTALLPKRVAVFGVSSMPPLYVKLLGLLARSVEVHLFYLCPAESWAGDAVTENALFASLGKLARDFQSVLEENADYVEPDGNLFTDPGSQSMLKTLQSDVLNLRRRSRNGDGAPPVPVSAADDSVAIVSCHSPMREVEVLRDQLLATFEANPTLEPHHVVVMMPNVDEYAPFIDAVFGVNPEERGYVPYRIADRTLRSQNAVADAFLAILCLLPSRMKASEVLDLLEHDPVRLRFEFSDAEIGDVARLVRRSGIRWGIDAQHRAATGQPPTDANTWRHGLRRLFLGHTLMPEPFELFGGVPPFPRLDPEDADRVGRLAELVETLFSMHERLASPRTVASWTADLSIALDAVTKTDDGSAWQKRDVRDSLAAMATDAARAGFDHAMTLEAMTSVLRERFEKERTTHEFVSGGVTFCAMLPMRSVPFRVVYLLGMNDADFPRRDRAPSFDCMTRSPRVGDRSVRDEDRHLFLEALLSARDRFIMSFVGRGVQDNAAYPPSVVVAQLIDVVGQSFVPERGGPSQLVLPFTSGPSVLTGPSVPPGPPLASLARSARPPGPSLASLARPSASFGTVEAAPANPVERLIVEHPLQAFDPRYFRADGGPLFSYSEHDLEGARALSSPVGDRVRFHTTPLVGIDDGSTLDLDDLARFFENPARALLQKRLGVRLDDEVESQEDREPVALAPLDKYAAGSDVFEALLQGADLSRAEEVARAVGVLPLGTPGSLEWQDLRNEVLAVAARASPWLGEPELRPLDVAVELGTTTLVGTLYGVYPRALVRARFARLKPKNLIAAWVRHLALQCEAPPGYPRQTALIGRAVGGDESSWLRIFQPLEPTTAAELLRELVHLYRLGQRAPLALFPNASKTYVDALRRNAGPGGTVKALSTARRAYSENEGAEAEDDYVRRVFSEVDPFSSSPVPFDEDGMLGLPTFERAALSVFEPLLDHCREDVP